MLLTLDQALLLTELLLAVDELHALLASPLLKLALQSRVVVILDVIVCAPRQMLGNFGPPVAVNFVQLENFLILFGRPFDLLDVRIQMVVPSIKARDES